MRVVITIFKLKGLGLHDQLESSARLPDESRECDPKVNILNRSKLMQDNDIQLKDTQHNGLDCNTQQK